MEFNPIILILPLLCLLMFALGLSLTPADFRCHAPRALLLGLVGQIILLPLIAFALAVLFALHPLFFLGLMLISACPGGSSSNLFSALAKGDIALSISLTAFSSVITLFTLPLIVSAAVFYLQNAAGTDPAIQPLGSLALPQFSRWPLLAQNLVLMALPIALGMAVRHWRPALALRWAALLGKGIFPALLVLAALFFMQHHELIKTYFAPLAAVVVTLIVLACALTALLCRCFALAGRQRRTLVIEVGMQNAAQSIALALSPFVFNDERLAIPAILYAFFMNGVLLAYLAFVRLCPRRATATP